MEKARENNKTMKVNCIKNTAERYTERYQITRNKKQQVVNKNKL